MATEKEARLARDMHQNELAEAGAHALSVEPIDSEGAKSYGIVAWVDEKSGKAAPSLPPSLEIEEQGRKVTVPIAVRKSKPFQLE